MQIDGSFLKKKILLFFREPYEQKYEHKPYEQKYEQESYPAPYDQYQKPKVNLYIPLLTREKVKFTRGVFSLETREKMRKSWEFNFRNVIFTWMDWKTLV